MSRRVRLVVASVLTACVLTFGPVVLTPEVTTIGLTGVENSGQYVSATVAQNYGILPARLRVWQN